MATTLKHVQESQGTATAPKEDVVLFEPPITSNVGAAPAQQEYVVFRLVNKKVRRLTLDGICHEVKNPNTGKHETIRLIRGAHSIWTSELTEFLKDKEYVNKNRIGLHFEDGICRIGMHETNKLEFARYNIHNVGKRRNGTGKYDFYEYDAAEEQKLRHEVRMKRIELIQTVSQMAEDKMIKLAMFLGIKPYDDEVGLPRTADGYRTELLILSDKSPEVVSKYLNSAEIEVSYLVRKGIMDAKIDLGGQAGNAIWAGGGGFICKIPSSQKPIQYLTEFAMTNSAEGRAFKEQLQTIVT